MTARILVVDDIPMNIRLLEVRLSAEYFEVVTAESGAKALELCRLQPIDLVLLDVMMPGMDGFEVCTRLKRDPDTAHIPVVMVTALDQTADRVRGLEAGADDFLTKPINDLQLMTRVKNLVRLKNLSDELRLRAETSRSVVMETLMARTGKSLGNPSFLLIDERTASAATIASQLSGFGRIDWQSDPQLGFFRAMDGEFDAVMVATGFREYDPLRIVAQLRSAERFRFLPIIFIADADESSVVQRGLELGVNDYIQRPVDPQEFRARITTQIRRKHYHEGLRASLSETLELAVTDPLTGLNNRRYLDTHLQTLFARARKRERPFSVMMTDLDRFKEVNDVHGHDGGDAVLQQFAQRLRRNVRGMDLACRFGGEEFAIVMPETDGHTATAVAERLLQSVGHEPFDLGPGKPSLMVTVSIGVASMVESDRDAAMLLRRADRALYDAKNGGRNRVIATAA